MSKILTEEEFIKESKKIIEEGTDEEQFIFAVNQTLALCTNLDLCAHCVSLAILDIMEQEEKNHSKEIH